uniref:Uncharacterized protein n=1 Tax=Anguilla anguilla TaxID=7936 RepID=A0A0E9U983_ANGAN
MDKGYSLESGYCALQCPLLHSPRCMSSLCIHPVILTIIRKCKFYGLKK